MEGIRKIVEENLIIEKSPLDRAKIELKAEELLISVLNKKANERVLHEFDDKYDANLTSLYYIIMENRKCRSFKELKSTKEREELLRGVRELMREKAKR